MTKKNPSAVKLGRLGGKAKSEAKTKAARANAQKRWAKIWLELCDCDQDWNPDPEYHASDCFGRQRWAMEKAKIAAAEKGFAELDAGQFVTHTEVGRRMKRLSSKKKEKADEKPD